MKIHRDVLRGLLVFRGKQKHLTGLRVSDDGRWLVASDHVSLAYGSVTDAQPGISWDGFGLENLLKWVPRGHEVLDLESKRVDNCLMYWDASDGTPLQVNRAEHQLPSPENLIKTMELQREGVAMAMSPVQLAKIGKALRPFDRMFVFPRAISHWTEREPGTVHPVNAPGMWIAGKTGEHELRIFTMPLHIAEENWPQ